MDVLSKNIKLLLIFIATVAIANTAIFFSGPFWDDYEFVFGNKAIVEGSDPFIFWKSGSGFERVWALGYSQFWVLVNLLGHSFWAYKLVSVIFHALNGLLLFKLAEHLKIRHAILGAFIFLLHPFHVETLSWIFQLNSIMGFFWSLLATLILVKLIEQHHEKGKKWVVLSLLAVSLCYFFAIKTKPVALLVPFCCICFLKMDFWRRYKWPLGIAGILVLVLGVYIAVRSNNAITNSTYENSIRKAYFLDEMFGRVAFGSNVTEVNSTFSYNTELGKFFLKLHLISRSFLFYVTSFLLPLQLLFIYPKWELNSAMGALSVTFLLATVMSSCYAFVKFSDKKLLFPIFMVFAGFLPISGIIYVPYMKYSYVADHWAYVMTAGLALVSVQILSFWQERVKIKSLHALAILFIIFLGFQQARYGRIFNSTVEMLEYNIKHNPRSTFLYQYLARIYIDDRRKDEAMRVIEAGLRMTPSDQQLLKLKAEI